MIFYTFESAKQFQVQKR